MGIRLTCKRTFSLYTKSIASPFLACVNDSFWQGLGNDIGLNPYELFDRLHLLFHDSHHLFIQVIRRVIIGHGGKQITIKME